jgi:hypothetical protein
MRKRGRVSAAAIGVTPVRISAKERPAPPAGLTAREREQWNEITAALRPDWFEAENLPLLAEYCRSPSYARGSRASFAKLRFWTRALPSSLGRGWWRSTRCCDWRPSCG